MRWPNRHGYESNASSEVIEYGLSSYPLPFRSAELLLVSARGEPGLARVHGQNGQSASRRFSSSAVSRNVASEKPPGIAGAWSWVCISENTTTRPWPRNDALSVAPKNVP